jgi:hypothetical protein
MANLLLIYLAASLMECELAVNSDQTCMDLSQVYVTVEADHDDLSPMVAIEAASNEQIYLDPSSVFM